MEKKEILFYETANDIFLKGKGSWYNIALAYILRSDTISNWIATRIANRVNKKWDQYVKMKEIGDFLNN